MAPQDWNIDVDETGEMKMQGFPLSQIAEQFGTPVFVINENLLIEKAREVLSSLRNIYPARSEVHYPFKCNSVPVLISILKMEGLKAEVMTPFELFLAKKLGYKNNEIIANGPCKTKDFLKECLDLRFIVIDSLSELKDLTKITEAENKKVNILFRINPDYTPKGMNSGSATGSRKGSVFGLDIRTNEVQQALQLIKNSSFIKFNGLHIHIGTGIRNPQDYFKAILSLKPLIKNIMDNGFKINVMDTGGGFSSPTTRELTTKELLLYNAFKIFPGEYKPLEIQLNNYISSITNAVKIIFDGYNLPELIIEPGRYLTSQCEVLLLKVHRIKERKGAGKWVITDGGIGTLTMPTYYEYHEVFLCSNGAGNRTKKYTISGPCCFSEDVVYKNKSMPEIKENDLLAVMDCGAYFNQWESNFGFMKVPIVSINKGKCRLIRRRETAGDMITRDLCNNYIEEVSNEIFNY